jgi:hypothetical protein
MQSEAEVEKAVLDSRSRPADAALEGPGPLQPAAAQGAAVLAEVAATGAEPEGAPRSSVESQQGQHPQPEALSRALHTLLSESADESMEAAEHSDGDSPRYTPHPSTVQAISAGAASSSGPLLPAKLKIAMPSWLQKVEPQAAAAAHCAESGGALVRSTSNASSEDSTSHVETFSAPPFSRDWDAGSSSEVKSAALAQPLALGLPMGRLTAEQAATAARLLMAGYSMDCSMEYAISPRDSPAALNASQCADSGHMLTGSAALARSEPTSRASNSPPTARASDRGLSSEPEQMSVVHGLSRQPGELHSRWTEECLPEPELPASNEGAALPEPSSCEAAPGATVGAAALAAVAEQKLNYQSLPDEPQQRPA